MTGLECPWCGKTLAWNCTSEIGDIGLARCTAHQSRIFNTNEPICDFKGPVERINILEVKLIVFAEKVPRTRLTNA
jgi:hypothetical protein